MNTIITFIVALAETTWLPGSARELDLRSSSLRDAPVFEATYGPRARTTLGIEPALVRTGDLRLGLYGAVALENVASDRWFPPNELWRGLVGATASWWFPLGAREGVELTFAFGHESDHADAYLTQTYAELRKIVYTLPRRGVLIGGEGELGEYAGADVAITRRVGPLDLRARVLEHVFVHGVALQQAGAELSARVATGNVQPLLATSGETIVTPAHVAPVFRALAGVAFPGRFGEVTPLVAFETGWGRGYMINVEKSGVSLGLRYTPF